MILFSVLIVMHVIASFFLIIVVLLQGGRGGLGEALGGAAAQSLFGGGTNIVMAKITTVTALIFATTCLSLAVMSTHRGQSVIEQVPEAGNQPLPFLPGESVPAESAAPAAGHEAHAHDHGTTGQPASPATETAPAAAATPAP